CVAAMAVGRALAASTQHQVARLEHDWAAERARMSGDALAELETKVAQTSVELRDLASHALNAPRERDGAFEQLTRTVRGDDRTVVLFRDDSAFAWSGRPRVPVNSLGDALGVVGTPFYLGLYASAHGSNQRTVATHLLYAVSPADRMVRSLGGHVVRRSGIAAWRDRREMAWRATLVAVGLACVALTPLSAFSNYSRLFDPALYFTPLGYSLTANAAALALTSALVLLLLLAAVRKQARLEARLLAVLIVLVVAGLGPFLLRDLARGIQIPSYGVSASLWLIWEGPLFLAAVSVILAAAAPASAGV